MNTKLFLMAIAVITAFGIAAASAAMVGPVTIATPALAQNMTGGGNMTGGNMTMGGNTTMGG